MGPLTPLFSEDQKSRNALIVCHWKIMVIYNAETVMKSLQQYFMTKFCIISYHWDSHRVFVTSIIRISAQ